MRMARSNGDLFGMKSEHCFLNSSHGLTPFSTAQPPSRATSMTVIRSASAPAGDSGKAARCRHYSSLLVCTAQCLASRKP